MGVHRQGAHEKHILRVKMDWLKPALLAALVICSSAQPLDQELGVNLEEQADMKELLTSMFIDNHRSARQLEEEEEEMSNMVPDSEDDLEEDEVTGLTTTDPQEIRRFNNYMDAIYRRMNAALRAKLMDPMVLNMNTRANKDTEGENINKKKRVERETGEGEHGNIIRKMEEIQGDKMNIMEEVDIVSIDRMGETSHEFNVKKNVGKVGKKALKKKRGNKKVKKNSPGVHCTDVWSYATQGQTRWKGPCKKSRLPET